MRFRFSLVRQSNSFAPQPRLCLNPRPCSNNPTWRSAMCQSDGLRGLPLYFGILRRGISTHHARFMQETWSPSSFSARKQCAEIPRTAKRKICPRRLSEMFPELRIRAQHLTRMTWQPIRPTHLHLGTQCTISYNPEHERLCTHSTRACRSHGG